MAKENNGSKKEGRLEKVIVTLLVILVSLLSFSVGVISGKNLSDQDYALKAEQKYSHALAEGGEGQEANDEMNDEEVNHIANAAIEGAEKNGGPKEDKAKAIIAAADHGSQPVVAADSKTELAPAAVSNTLAKGAVPSEEDRTLASVNRKTSAPEFTVQVAAYQALKDAQTMSAELNQKGLPAFPFKVTLNGQTWYRVSVGSFKTRKEALAYQETITKQGAVKDSVVQKISR